ncbi:carboxypeptidase-like protein [Pontibacter ummariensis]|uniref:CarboxypepD_reg-like domain-containing protein n=2 Tax=Pontibacter ummariensis TaxID=1610492 RepID=A0A239D2M3_9BACT|nr:carboxypeptidase-like protein [Pontibacter ummariensis]SNS26600.1 CarboxypepD_reg-like domain-containing protein [Pontibacter ummariensis]
MGTREKLAHDRRSHMLIAFVSPYDTPAMTKLCLQRALLPLVLFCTGLLSSSSKVLNPAQLKTEQVTHEALTVKGIVLDEKTHLPVPYANIAVLNNLTGTQTNARGEFVLSLKAGPEARIKVTSVGYIAKEYQVSALLGAQRRSGYVKLFLKPDNVKLGTVEVKTKAGKWKTTKAGFNIDQGSVYHHTFEPVKGAVPKASGQEIGNRIQLKKYPADVQSISFGLTGSGDFGLVAGVRLYSLKDNKPSKNLLPENVQVQVPPHHTGWITVKLDQYRIRLHEDVAVVIEWLNEENKLTKNSLLTFASFPKEQVIYYRNTAEEPWKVLRDRSIGMYLTVLQEK